MAGSGIGGRRDPDLLGCGTAQNHRPSGRVEGKGLIVVALVEVQLASWPDSALVQQLSQAGISLVYAGHDVEAPRFGLRQQQVTPLSLLGRALNRREIAVGASSARSQFLNQ